MKSKKKGNNVRYSKAIILFSLLLFALMIGRVTQLALSKKIDGIDLKELASKRTTRTQTLSAKRGNIYSKDGEVLAQNVSAYKLIAYLDPKRTTNKKKPQHVVDKEKTAEALAPILNMEKDEVLKYLNKENVYQTEFGSKGKNLTELVKKQIEDLKSWSHFSLLKNETDFFNISNLIYYKLTDFLTSIVGKNNNFVLLI